MLRTAVLLFATVLTAIGVVLFLKGITVPGIQAGGIGILLILGTLFERWRYTQSDESGGKHWEPTGERFTDPTTGRIVEVMYDPTTGERRYVEPQQGTLHKPS
jgi:hypothetical protein